MIYACAARFVVTVNLENLFDFGVNLNKAQLEF